MKLLIVVGYDLQHNSSANLCHLAYINGFVENGHDVTLLTAKSSIVTHDNAMNINSKVKVKYFSNDTLVMKLNKFFRKSNTNLTNASDKYVDKKISLKKIIKNLLINKIYMFDYTWMKRASRFKSKEYYDYVISLAYPPASHKVVNNLIERKSIKYGKYIQIWEDPWIEDLFFSQDRESVKKEEEKLLSVADLVYYVSPITLYKQKKLFPYQQAKMKWMPLPAYYEQNDQDNQCIIKDYVFGYFGDYIPYVRDLSKFYNVMKDLNYTTYICGNPYNLFNEVNYIHIFPRKPLKELEELEKETSVLVFLCNIKGGQIPGKLYQYASTNKLILFILDGTDSEKQILYNYFSKFNRFVFCENDEVNIKRAITEILNSKYAKTAFKLEYFTPKNITKKIIFEEDES